MSHSLALTSGVNELALVALQPLEEPAQALYVG